MKLHSRILLGCALILLPLMSLQLAAQEANSSAGGPLVFVFVQRASSHVKYSKSDVFHDVLNDVLGYVKEKNVAMATDQFGGRSNSENEMPLATVQGIARDAGATYLLYALVERPITKWIKVSVRCYDMAGQKLWEEQAESGGGMSGGHGLRVTLDRLHERLDTRVGQPGLPVAAAVANTTEPVPTAPQALPQK